MSFNLDNYTTVDERIVDFYTRYPKGLISTRPAKVVEIGGKTFVSVIAEVWPDTDSDPIRAVTGEAWELFPGTTPYTRDSEMMNCATSAIGRALMQLGIGIKPGALASRDEVQAAIARKATDAPKQERHANVGGRPASEAQRKLVFARLMKAGIVDQPGQLGALTGLLKRPVTSIDDLYFADIDIIAGATPDQLQQARLQAMGLQIVEEDDPWAGETLA